MWCGNLLTIIYLRDYEGTNMRKIILLSGMILITLTALGCSKKSQESANEGQMSPAPAAQESAPAMEQQAAPMNNNMGNDSMDKSSEQSAPMSGDSMGKPEDSNDNGSMDDHSQD
jgi:hypothetical protein